METITATCINCGVKVEQNYCAHCGQQNPPKKLSVKSLWYDFQSRIYGFDGAFPRTLLDLTIRPGVVAREYIAGNRVKYNGPVSYFFILITTFLLLASLLGVGIDDLAKIFAYQGTSDLSADQSRIAQIFNHWMFDNFRLLSFVSAFNSIIFLWLLFKRSGYNFVETGVLIFFVNGHVTWMSIVALLIYSTTGSSINVLFSTTVYIGYSLFAIVNFYTYQSKLKVLFKGVLALLLSFFLMMIVGVFIAIIYLKAHPELIPQER